MNNSTESNHPSGNDIAESISIASIVMILYVVGVCLHIRIIKVSKKTKDMTWKLDITHSILCIGLYTYNVLIHSTTYFIEDLHLYTGKWFCYVAKVISQFLIIYLATHSTIIAAMKYVVIVHEEKIRNFKSKIKKDIFCSSLFISDYEYSFDGDINTKLLCNLWRPHSYQPMLGKPKSELHNMVFYV